MTLSHIVDLLIGAILVLGMAFLFGGPPVRACEPMVASHYGAESGSRTADGSFFDGTQMVAAHKTWKLGTPIRVTYQGKSVKLIVRDRGPYIRGRSLDISTAAARRLGMVKVGVARVCVTRLR